MGGQRRGKNRRQGGDGSVHQPGEPGLHNLQNEEASLSDFLIGLHVRGEFLFVEFLGAHFVSALFIRQVIQQLPNARILRARRGFLIESPGLDFHRRCLFTHRLNAQRSHQPQCRTLHKPPHVLAPNQRNVLPESPLIKFQQAPPVSGLFFAHPFKHRSGGRIIWPEPFGEIRVHSLVFFLQSDGQRKDFAFRKFFEFFHDGIDYLPC